MQMLNVLILVSIGLLVYNFIYSLVNNELEGKDIFSAIIGLVFYILAAVFGGTWALAIGLIYGVAARTLFMGDEINSKKHPVRYVVSFVMVILFIIAIINYDNTAVQTITNGVLLVK